MSEADDTETRRPYASEGVDTTVVDLRGDPARIHRFTLLERIGVGGMGELHAAYDAQLDRKIALKLVRSGRGGREAEARLLREAQALAKLSHPNVVTVYEVGVEAERVFVVMEYIHGQTLTVWLAEQRSLPEHERVPALLARFADAARGLIAIHRAGLAHRDFKPDNVLVGVDGRVRVVDFGLARSVGEPSIEHEPMSEYESGVRDQVASELDSDRLESMLTPEIETMTGTVLGTPRYMAPEQWRARRGDSRSDQFSFCVALYWALFGSWPFGGDVTTGLRAAVIAGDLQIPPRKPEVPARLHAALIRGLECAPEDRWPDMAELLAAIDQALAPERKRVGVWLGVAGLVLTIVGTLVARRPEPLPLPLDAALTQIEHELVAERRRVQIDQQVATLDAAGQPSEADAVFDAFASQPEYANTRALALAWLDHAERLRVRGDASGELAALGEAQLASPSPDLRHRALFGLARVFLANHQFDRLGATSTMLDALDQTIDPADKAELLAMQIAEAASRRDFASALEILREPGAEAYADLRPLLDQLGRAQLGDHQVGGINVRASAIALLPSLDRDGDGQGELVFTPAEGGLRLLASNPELELLQELELPIDPSLPGPLRLEPIASALGRSGAPDWINVDIDTHAARRLLALDEAAGEVRAKALPVELVGVQWATGDLFAGPGWSGWEALGADSLERRLTGLREVGLEPFEPSPDLAALRSVVQSVAIADLDGDELDELIVGVGAWWAYDVRVLSPARERPGEFELAARRKLGSVEGLIAFPAPNGQANWIALTLPDSLPSPRVFPNEARAGQPSGVHILAWSGPGQALELVDHVPLPISFRPGSGDLDHDGRAELVVQMPTAIAVLHAGRDDRYSALWIDGLWYHAIVDLDGDGDDELIVSELEGEHAGRLVVLGSGDARIPLHDRHSPRAAEPPAELDHGLASIWRQAEALALIGLFDQARAALVGLARLASPNEATLALRRAAELATNRDAAELYEGAGDRDSLARAVELYEQSHHFAQALRVARQLALVDPSGSARVEALGRLAEPEQRLDFDFDQPLDPSWRIERAGLLRHEPGGLRVECIGAEDSVIARRAIEWTGERLEIEVDLDIARFEWASGLFVTLVPVDESGQPRGAAIAERALDAWGGGDHYMLDASRGMPMEPGGVGDARVMRGALPPAGQHRFRLRIDLLAGGDHTWSTITTLDGTGPRDTAFEMREAADPTRLRPGRYELQIRSGIEPWARGVVRLERLRVLGARDDPDAPTPSPRQRALRDLANGDHERALDQLDHAEPHEFDPRDAAWLRALALEQLGRWPLARPFLDQALGDCRGPEALARFGHAILLQPDRVGPTLRQLCPPAAFLADTWAVTQGSLFQHKDLLDLHRTLTTLLVDLDRYEPRDLDEALATLGLLTSRARGWLMQEAGSAAESDLRRAIELSQRWIGHSSLTREQSEELRRVRAIAHLELALVLMTREQRDAALDELDRALAVDPAPEIIADVIAARGVFEPLAATGLWATIERAQLGLSGR